MTSTRCDSNSPTSKHDTDQHIVDAIVKETSIMTRFREEFECIEPMLFLIADLLMMLSGITQLFAWLWGPTSFGKVSNITMIIIGGIYVSLVVVLIANFYYFRIQRVMIISIAVSLISFFAGTVRFVQSGMEWTNYVVVVPVIADIIIIPSLTYLYLMWNHRIQSHSQIAQMDIDGNREEKSHLGEDIKANYSTDYEMEIDFSSLSVNETISTLKEDINYEMSKR